MSRHRARQRTRHRMTVVRRPAAALLVAVVATLGACGQRVPDGARPIRSYSVVGDCLRPDPDDPDAYRQAPCRSGDATAKILDMVDATGGGARRCPDGTDVLVDGEQGPVVDGGIAAEPRTWCLRNLAAPHPGDPGEGGGELVVLDCFTTSATRSIVEAPCEGGGADTPQQRVLAFAPAPSRCPAATTESIELDGSPALVLCAGRV